MEKPYFKCVLLVLASNNFPVYQKLRKIYQLYHDANPNVKVILVYGKTELENKQEHELVYDDIEENYYPGMITKTMRAMDHIEKNYDYDFLVRTNISTFWDFNGLLTRLEKMPSKECFIGNLRRCIYKAEKSPQYVAGVNLVLSRDLVQLMVNNQKEVIGLDLPEDWAMSQFLINRGYTPKHTIPRAMRFMEKFTHPLDVNLVHEEIQDAKKTNNDHYRIKSKNDRDLLDAEIANILLKEYYGKEAVF